MRVAEDPLSRGRVDATIAVDPTHRYVVAADFGADRIFVYRFDGTKRTLTPAPTPFEAVPPGSGPRHPVFHPNGTVAFALSLWDHPV